MSRQTEITLKMLHAFLTWAESESEDEAAHKLGITQPAFHRKLERFHKPVDGGPRLIARARGGWELTSEGRLILPVIRDLVHRFKQLETHLANRNEAPRVIRIATGQFDARFILPRAIAVLRERLAGCRFETHLARGFERILGVANAEYDIAIVTHSSEQVHAIIRKYFQTREQLMTCAPLVRYPFAVVAHRDSSEGQTLLRLPQETAVTAAQLGSLTLVGLDPHSGLRQRLEKLAGEVPLHFSTDTSAGGWPAALAFAEHKLGAAIIPLPALPANFDHNLVARPIDAAFALEKLLIKRSDFCDSTSEITQEVFSDAARSAGTAIR